MEHLIQDREGQIIHESGSSDVGKKLEEQRERDFALSRSLSKDIKKSTMSAGTSDNRARRPKKTSAEVFEMPKPREESADLGRAA
jgi:hypothetical protein